MGAERGRHEEPPVRAHRRRSALGNVDLLEGFAQDQAVAREERRPAREGPEHLSGVEGRQRVVLRVEAAAMTVGVSLLVSYTARCPVSVTYRRSDAAPSLAGAPQPMVTRFA